MTKIANESGSVLVFVTLMIVVLLFMVGMGMDTGWLTFSRSMGQRAVDMAALSGAAGLAKGDEIAIKKDVEATLNDYVKASGNPIDGTVGGKNVTLVKYDSATGSITPETDINNANGVRVGLETTNPYTGASSGTAINTGHFLTPLLNLLGTGSASTATDIDVSAVAVYSAIPGIPLALGRCSPGVQNIFFQTPSGGSNPNNSAWTTYTVNETNTPDLIARINAIVNCQGGGAVGVGTPICLSNGQNTPVVEAFEQLADPNGNKCYFTPVVSDQQTFTGCTAEENKIKSWAEVCIKYVCAPPDSNTNPNCDKSIGEKYIVADVKRCDLTDNERVGQCFKHTLVREKNIGM
jgi:Flp pilus assembly protein TadG